MISKIINATLTSILHKQELKSTTSKELGCICPAGSCIGDPYDSADYEGVQIVPCLCVDHSSPSFEHTTTRSSSNRGINDEQSQFRNQNVPNQIVPNTDVDFVTHLIHPN